MKKILLSLLIGIMLIGGVGANGTPVAYAQSAEAQIIAQLQLQIQALQAQISQLIAAQGRTNVTLAALVRIMTAGTSGDDVKVLQALLAADASIYVDPFITGFYGPLTTRAVSRFQAQQGLTVTGTVDASTLARLQAKLKDMPIGLEVDAATGTRRPCAAVPPGHLIAPGWLRVQVGSIGPIVPVCQTLPPGISAQISGTAGISAVTGTSITNSSATINFTTNVSATGKVYYSTVSPVNMSTSLSATGSANATVHAITLTGLAANTTYYFVIEARDSAGGATTSVTYSFSTNSTVDINAPVISGAAAVNVSSNSATVNFTTNEAATGKVYFSAVSPVNLSTSASVTGSAGLTSHSINMVNLSANTTYYFVVEAWDASGNKSVSAQGSFTTTVSGSGDTSAPVMSAIAIAVTANSAIITWNTNEMATGKVYYSLSTPVNTSTAASVTGSSNLTAHAINLVGLSSNTTYYIVLESRDASNNVSMSAQYQFTTQVQ